MNNKLLNKLISTAEVIDRAEINGSKLTIENIEDFYNQKGKLFFVKSENSFYKFDNSWFKLEEKEKIKELPKEDDIKLIKKAILEPEKDKYAELVIWANNFKEYVDNKFKEIEKKQEESIKIIKENIDLKFKSLDKTK